MKVTTGVCCASVVAMWAQCMIQELDLLGPQPAALLQPFVLNGLA